MKKRVDIYCRLSDEDRYKKDKYDDSESIANQKSMLLKYAISKDWEVNQIYSDDDYSGADINRPGFQKMLKDCENGKVDIVLCKTQSRFSRDMEIIEKYIHNKFIEWNVRFVSIVDNADTDIKGNKKARQINGLINEWYLEDLSDNIRTSLKNKREDGLFMGSFAPYGYIKDPHNKNHLIVDPVASEIVKYIFELYKSGMGYSKIADVLNKKCVKTPSQYKRENGSNYICGISKPSGSGWSKHTISKILKSEVYIGNLVQGVRGYVSYKNHKSFVRPKSEWSYSINTHEAIIDKDTWNYCKNKFNLRSRICRTSGLVYMLSCKVYCMQCNGIFTKNLYHTKCGKTAYLKCKTRASSISKCANMSSIRCDVIEKIILEEINKYVEKYYDLSIIKENLNNYKIFTKNNCIKKMNYLKKEKESLKIKIEKANNYYKKLYENKVDGIICDDGFNLLKSKYIKDLEDYKNRLSIIDKSISECDNDDSLFDTGFLEKRIHINKLTKNVVDQFIDCIFIGNLDKLKNERKIFIKYNI